MRELARHLARSVLLSGLLLVAHGCAGPPDPDAASEGDASTLVGRSRLEDPAARQGLEVRMLIVDDTDHDAPRLLREFTPAGEGAMIDERTRERWASWGFRLIEVPLDRLEETLGAMRVVRPISKQWLGEFGDWRPIVRTGEQGARQLRVGEAMREIDAGRPRIVARSWGMPELSETGVRRTLRLDLGVQIESPRSGSVLLLPDPRTRTLDDDGAVIDELLTTISMRGDRALVIVGEAPEADWSSLPEPSSPGDVGDENAEGGGSDDEDAPVRQPAPGSLTVVGPSVPPTPTLGELMFVVPGSRMMRAGEVRPIPRRVVIVLIPSVGDDGGRSPGGFVGGG